MSRRVTGLVVWLVTMASAPSVSGEEASTAAEPAVAPVGAPVAAPPKPKPKTKEDGVRMQLEGTEWTLTLTPENGKAKTDTLTFGKQTVKSQRLSKAGYPETQYSLTFNGDTPVWDTMQSKEGGEGVVLWHGEVHGSTMTGAVNEQLSGKTYVNFSISGSESGGKVITVPRPEDLQPSTPTPAVSSGPAKNKGGLLGQ